MICRADADGIDVLPCQKFAEVGVGLAGVVLVVGIDRLLGPLADFLPDVTDGDDLGLWARQLLAHIEQTSGADAKVAGHNPLTCRRPPVTAEGCRRNDTWGRRHPTGRCSSLQKLAPSPTFVS